MFSQTICLRLWGIAALCSMNAAAFAATLVSADVHKPDHPVVQSQEFLGKALAERTKGEWQVVVKHSGELGSESAVLEKVRKGELDMARINMGVLADTVPAAKLMSLPYLFRSREHMWKVLKGDFGKRLGRELEATGAVALTFYDSGTRSFYSVKKAIRTRQDFEGMRVRVQPSPVYKDLITGLGGTPVPLPYDKVVGALRDGEIDAAENNLPSYVGSEHYKYARYLSLDEHSMVPEVLLISKKAWDKLGAQQQAHLSGAAEASAEFMGKLWAAKERESLDAARKAGVTIVEKKQMSLTGIEGAATKLYTTYITDPADLDTVIKIMQSR